ncbi:MAG: SDR family oxidoreductase [Holosporaceae bacterium]|jgi:NAD(P)-dependent dehydrogenase (short-subunit alcohol dehydrogenase family)|nr:SDR family oxidoreductase [Holosporaceae bacterium]
MNIPFNLGNKNAIITGASRGLGLEIARHFIKSGVANLAICARDESVLNNAAAELSQLADVGQKILSMPVDIADFDQISGFCQKTIDEFGHIHILVNNAGVYGPKGQTESIDWNEWQNAMSINLNGSVLMCLNLLPHFKKNRYGKIIQVSGGGATNPMPYLAAYAVSKTAIVRFIESLAHELRDFNIDANCIAPGLLDTRLLDEVLNAGSEIVGKDFHDRMAQSKSAGNTTPLSFGAELATFLASEASDGITGRLISAKWDNWREWPNHLEELQNSDLYTLRRISGRDRGKTWGDK